MRLSLPLGLVISLACAGFSLADDPTRPLYTPPDPAALALHAKTAKPATPAEPVLRVDYLLYAPQRRLVRINGELLSEGRHIQGWTVTRIEWKPSLDGELVSLIGESVNQLGEVALSATALLLVTDKQ